MKFLFCYSGLGNIGDDLMFKGLVNNYEPGTYICRTKQYKIKDELETKGSFDYFIQSIKSHEFMIVGGNIFSYERPISYGKLLNFYVIFLLRKILKKKTTVDSIGLDLNEGVVWRSIVRSILKLADQVSIRDELSFRYLRASGLDVKYSFDRVYRERKNIFSGLDRENSSDSIIWWVSHPAAKKNSNTYDENKTKIIIDEYVKDSKVLFFCQEPGDVVRANYLVKENDITEYEIRNYSYIEIDSILESFNTSKIFVTERYHGAVIAEALNIPWVSIPFSEKLNRLKPNKMKIN
ncbi:polysaccharide pyruvyl transferase family protein [Vibrio cyclitrophicus]